MFCDGVCEKGKKKCGLFYSIFMENTISKKVEEVKKCVFLHMADSFMRLEHGDIRIQAAIESSRNERANADKKMSSVVATGFIGMLHAFDENPDKFKRSLNVLNSISNKKMLENKNE